MDRETQRERMPQFIDENVRHSAYNTQN